MGLLRGLTGHEAWVAGRAAVLAVACGTGVLMMPRGAQAEGIDSLITQGSVESVQLLGEGRVLTAEEAAMMLAAEGFEVIETKRTLLGRIRIVAEGPQGQREIVLHAGDGRVLRDLFTEGERPAAIIRPAEPVMPVLPQVPAVVIAPEPPLADAPSPPDAPVAEPTPPAAEVAPPEEQAGNGP